MAIKGSIQKKNVFKAVRLTAWGGGGGVTPLQPDRFYFVKILTPFVLYKMAKYDNLSRIFCIFLTASGEGGSTQDGGAIY